MDIKKASEYSINNIEALKNSKLAACYFCKSVYEPSKIIETTDEGKTALCPKCGIDSVLTDNSPFDFDKTTLSKLHDYWF